MSLPDNATIHDALPALRNPVDYVRGILATLIEHRTPNAAPIVRIGITGQGISPYYRIDRNDQAIAAFNGDSHRPFQNIELHDSNWSNAALTIEEVQAILGELRQMRRRQ